MLASHNNCRAIAPGDRQYSDEQIRAIIERDGVIGAPFDAWMMVPGWTPDRAKSPQVILDSADEPYRSYLPARRQYSSRGDWQRPGWRIRIEQTPEDLDTIADLQGLRPLLRKRGYSEADIKAIFHGNWLRFFERAWNTTLPATNVSESLSC